MVSPEFAAQRGELRLLLCATKRYARRLNRTRLSDCTNGNLVCNDNRACPTGRRKVQSNGGFCQSTLMDSRVAKGNGKSIAILTFR
jgi:hypothetical protein